MMKELAINTMQLVPITREELVELRDELFDLYRMPDSLVSRFTIKKRMNEMRKNLVIMKTKLEAVDQLLEATNKKEDKRMREQFRVLYQSVYELVIHFNVVVPIVKKKYNNCSSIRTVKMERIDDFFEGGDSDGYLSRAEFRKTDIGKLLKKNEMEEDPLGMKKAKKKKKITPEMEYLSRF